MQILLGDLLKDLSDSNGKNQVEVFDPDSPPPGNTDVLIVPEGLGEDPIEINLENLGDTPILDGRNADVGIQVDLKSENAEDETLPETRAILGSDHADQVIGGQANLAVDLGDGNDSVVTGAGDDTIYMGAGDDTIRLGGFNGDYGNDYIDGGDGEKDTLILNGSAEDWARVDVDGVTTWTNATTGQTVTTVGVETFEFEFDNVPNSPSQTDTTEDDDDDL
ncbi:hypothetical protein CCR95_04645 [Thiocystis minor]|uniref:hypothetical protein n=1 Tax=Thiocystis minor TaxID=61597 RepID=UPI001912F4C0|nr:hypothetical protein [Thiocystis minor]MBK5963397.1 hypothetical protein [Thiocystis minor]